MRHRLTPILFAAIVLVFAADAARADNWKDCASNDFERTIKGCTAIIKAKKDTKQDLGIAYTNRGWRYYDKGEFGKSMQDFDASIEIYPKYYQPYLGRGFVFTAERRFDESLAALDQGIKLFPKQPSLFVGRGDALHDKGDYEAALVAYNQALKLNPTFADGFNGLGRVYDSTKRYDEALDAYTKANRLNPKETVYLANRGLVNFHKGDIQNALQDYEKTLKLNPDYAFARRLRAEALYYKNDMDAALAEYEKVFELTPNDYYAIAGRADIYQKIGNFDLALKETQRAIPLNPQSAGAVSVTGFAQLEKGDFQSARASFARAVELDGNFGWPRMGQGELFLEEGNADAALAEFEAACQIDQFETYCYSGRGRALLLKGDVDAALRDFDKALTMLPENGDASYGRGLAYAAKGDLAKAAQDLQTSLIKYRTNVRLQKRAEQKLAELNNGTTLDTVVAVQDPAVQQPNTNTQSGVTTNKKRLALVIGNGQYQNANNLINPPNDARAISARLSGLGFDIISGEDLDHASMQGKLREFAEKTSDYDVALFYYAGHGIQVGDTNYLVPIDAKMDTASAVDFELIDVKNAVVKYMGGENQTGIIMLDSCRDNPLTRSFKRRFGKTRAVGVNEGLAAMSTEDGGLLIAFATAPGDVAADGEGQNSPFTTALLKHIGTPGLELEQMMKRVKKDVYTATNKQQQPWVNSALRDEIYLVGN